MQTLPIVTEPPDEPVTRRHKPTRGPYPTYRDCLRWEFGFSCAFCLVHEADMIEGGIDGTGLTWIEHFEGQRSAPGRSRSYGNCYYSCRFCNGAKGKTSVKRPEDRLLNPCLVAWGRHFEAVNDCLLPRDGDGDARFTRLLRPG